MKTFYLDTSAINHLSDDPNSSILKSALKGSTQIYISVFTIAELASTSNTNRRVGLLGLAKDIAGEFRPAAMPSDLLKRSIQAINSSAANMTNSIGHEWDGIWAALNDPALIDEKAFREISDWKLQEETWFTDLNSDNRLSIQEKLTTLSTKERDELNSNFSTFIKSLTQNRDFLKDFVSVLASHSGTELQINSALTDRLIKDSEHWRFFLAGMAYGLYTRSVKSNNFSRRKNPGSIDTQQSIYFTICDVFVTADKPQYRMLRLISPFGHKRRKVWNYSEFASYLLNECKDS